MNIGSVPVWRIILAAGFLIPALMTDLREKKINIIPCIAGILLAILTAIPTGDIKTALWGLIPGTLIIMTALMTKGAIGLGDGFVLTLTGSFMGFWKCTALLFAALFIAMVISLILLATKKASKKTEFPFVPFICAGFAIAVFL